MARAKLAPNLPDWMVEHTNRYLSSGGTDGHMYKMTQPGRPEMTVPSLLLTTKGRKSGRSSSFRCSRGGRRQLFRGRLQGRAPQHPGWYQNILADPVVEVQVGTRSCRRGRGPPRARNGRGSGTRR